ncbi:uncharacterized protein LOC111267177 [Varroa jacobsoni]|uniref:Uncharacterized protein n=1 Tax=Varroa destructor TaxID=109461 RepID=A0A7M7M9G2_VARDE|nr:uncharacterized protein LOC111249707 [Varroa destructor]XP_022700982.1 uncharacterized protein LOC111267177 [Varroa jacobsoni]
MSSVGGQIVALVLVLLWTTTVNAAILKPSIQDCLKNLPPLGSLSLDMNQLVSMIPVAEESCQCVGRAGGAITEIFAEIFTQKLGLELPECLMKAVRESKSRTGVGFGSTYSFFENFVASVVSEITNDLLFGRDETIGAHDMGSL